MKKRKAIKKEIKNERRVTITAIPAIGLPKDKDIAAITDGPNTSNATDTQSLQLCINRLTSSQDSLFGSTSPIIDEENNINIELGFKRK